jgi:hypothetical protein
MAANASLGGGEIVRVLGRTEIPLTVYDDLYLLPASPRAGAPVGRQVGGAGPASPSFLVIDEYSPLAVTGPRRLRVRRPGGAAGGDVPPPGLWQSTGEFHGTRRRMAELLRFDDHSRVGPDQWGDP